MVRMFPRRRSRQAVQAFGRWLFSSVSWVAALGFAVTPTRTYANSMAVQRVDTAAPVVALTFDACPTKPSPAGFDHEVFDILRREAVPATVFVSGQWVKSHPQEARRLAAEPLIEFGNHSFAHPPLSRISLARLRSEIAETDRMIGALGRKSVGIRPPFGDWAPEVLQAVQPTPLVLWDVVSGDAGGHVPAARMVEDVTRRTRAGSIVIFHINGRGPETKSALPEIIRRLRARGLRFVPVSELLAQPDAAVVQALPGRDSYAKRPYYPEHECD
jgi:peptidoglycan/xylan/chitin deacetylase (PgdA/CDA1 family)